MKANILINTLNMDKETWREWRKAGIGGSEVGAICGINPYSSPLKVYLDKIGEGEEIEENEKMHFGNVLEEVVADEFVLRSGKKVRRRNAMLQHPVHTFMIANVDREVIGENAILECKTASAHMEKQWDEGIPDSYMLQIQHYMYVGGYDKAYIAVLIGGNHFVWKEIKRDDELIAYIIDIETDFWNKVVNHIPPEVDGSEATRGALERLYPRAKENAPVVQLESKFDALIRTRENFKENINQLQKEIDEIENKIKSIIQDSEAAETKDYLITWKNCKGKETFNTKAFKKDYPNIADKYLGHGKDYRTLKINKKEIDANGK